MSFSVLFLPISIGLFPFLIPGLPELVYLVLFPFPLAFILVLLVVSHQTDVNTTMHGKYYKSRPKHQKIHTQCQRKQCLMDIQSET